MIKILHIADLHLGLEFSRYPTIADLLKNERLNAIKLFVNRANEEHADAIVIAGDLFDKLTIPQKLVLDTKSILSSFNGEVIVIPGNHDWYNTSANENKIWNWFLDAPRENVHFLNQWKPYTFNFKNREVVFYPCGCHQKHSENNILSWVREANKNEKAVNIGIAHGNVDGYGLDEEGRYFNMTQEELKACGMDCWLLGHIHAPYPNTDEAGHEIFFFAGNHCSDSWKAERTGGAWLIEIDENKNVKAKRWNHNGICFRNRYYTINSLSDLQSVIAELHKMNSEQTVLRLTLSGSLTEDELQESKAKIEKSITPFLFIEKYWNIELKITSDVINKLYAKDSIPHTLLTILSENEDDSLAMQLAYKTIKSLS